MSRKDETALALKENMPGFGPLSPLFGASNILDYDYEEGADGRRAAQR
jgi:hypothetical protein